MNTTTWIMQGILATVFLASGIIIYLLREKLKPKLSWLNEYSPKAVLLICIAKIMGAIGLIVPMLTGIFPVLTPMAASGIATIMALAFAYHIKKKEYKDIPATIIFFGIALFIAYNRF